VPYLKVVRDGGLNDRLGDLDGEQAQAFAAPLAMAAHAERAGADARFVNALGGSIHIVTVTPFRGSKSGS
jgi:hypothetical protein